MTRDEILAAVKSGTNLSATNLSGADLSGAKLFGADLSGADLSEANLSGANLYGANLYGANLYGANLFGAIGIVCLGTDPRGYRFVGVKYDDGWRVLAGCRWFTIAQANEHWKAKKNKDALARVAILKVYK